MIFTGEASIRSSFGGPIFIAKLAGDSARSGMWSLLGFMAFLSLNLGLLNLLPIPVLDGGHLVFIAIESAIRKPLPVKVKLIIQQVGMALLFLFMAFIIYNDVLKIIK
jgi:regulator of sigma E protease